MSKTIFIPVLAVVLLGNAWASARSVESQSDSDSEPVVAQFPPDLIATLPFTDVAAMALNSRARQVVLSGQPGFTYVDTRSLRYRQIEADAIPGQVVVDPKSGRLFSAAGTVFQIHERDGTLLFEQEREWDHIYVRVSINPSMGTVYAIQWDDRQTGSRTTIVQVYSIRTAELITSFNHSFNLAGPAFDRSTGYAWFYGHDYARVWVFDGRTHEPVASLSHGGALYPSLAVAHEGMVVVPELKRAYLLALINGPIGLPDGAIRVFDTEAFQELAPIPLWGPGVAGFIGPEELAYNARTKDLFVRSDYYVSVIDTETDELKTQTELPDTIQYAYGGFELDARRGFLYVPCWVDGSDPHFVAVLSAWDYSILTEIPIPNVGLSATNPVLDPATGRFFVASGGGIHVIGPGPITASAKVSETTQATIGDRAATCSPGKTARFRRRWEVQDRELSGRCGALRVG